MSLTESQQLAKNWYFSYDSVGTLIGAAGTGKTYLIASIIEDILVENPSALIAVSAPTNKAVRVLEEKLTQFNINKLVNQPEKGKISLGTIHKFLRSIPSDNEDDESDLKFNSESAIAERPYYLYDYVFIDEASMINNLLYQLIKESVVGKCLYIGDPYQLFPVKENRVSAPFREIRNVCYLDGVVRYEGNILKLASRIRDRIEDESIDYPFVFAKSQENITVCKEKVEPEQSSWFADFLYKAVQEANSQGNPRPDYLRMLVYKRRTLEVFSTLIRKNVYGGMALSQYMPGECLFSHQPFYAYYNLKQHMELFDLSWLKSRTEEQANRTRVLLEDRDRARKHLTNSEDFLVKNCEIKTHTFLSPLSSFYHPQYATQFANWKNKTLEFCLVNLSYRGYTYEVALLTDEQRKAYAAYIQYVLDYWEKYQIPEYFLTKYKYLLNNTFNTQFEYQYWENSQDAPYCYQDGNQRFKVTNKLYSSFVITVHKSQGTTINENFFNYSDCFTRNPQMTPYEINSNLYRLLYTAVTRTSDNLYVLTKR